ncbi:MAG: type II secretion system F family protein [Opitutales bacterium]|nr:type II secretion system F family protein [Opitutales bacterium]
MPKFKYTAIDRSGKQKSGSIEADSREAASAELKGQGIFVTNLEIAKGKGKGASAAPGTKKKKRGIVLGPIINEKGLTVFTRQLATLITSGLPLLRAIEVLEKQERNVHFKDVISELAENVRSGNTFSDGLMRHPKVFDRLYVNMVKAGEAGGVLDVVLNRLATFMEKSLKVKGKIKSAMVYPTIVLGIAVIILTFLLIFVVPRFEEIFDDMLDGASLPLLTQIVLGASDFLVARWYFILAILVALYFGFKGFKKTPRGAYILDKMLITMPPLSDLFRKSIVSRFSRTFGTLLSSGVPILDCLNITKNTVGNQVIANALESVHDRVKEGDSVSAPLEDTKVFPVMVTSMIDVGEETGELPEMLNRVADTYDEEVDNAVGALTSIIEPIMIVLLALIVGVIVIALFLPIVGIIQNLTG